MTLDVRQRITLNDSQPTLTLAWPGGRPSSAPTVSFYHPGYPWDTSPNPLVDAATTTLSAVNTTVDTAGAAAASRTVPVVVRTGMAAGDRLWLTSSVATEEVEIASIAAGAGTKGTLRWRQEEPECVVINVPNKPDLVYWRGAIHANAKLLADDVVATFP